MKDSKIIGIALLGIVGVGTLFTLLGTFSSKDDKTERESEFPLRDSLYNSEEEENNEPIWRQNPFKQSNQIQRVEGPLPKPNIGAKIIINGGKRSRKQKQKKSRKNKKSRRHKKK